LWNIPSEIPMKYISHDTLKGTNMSIYLIAMAISLQQLYNLWVFIWWPYIYICIMVPYVMVPISIYIVSVDDRDLCVRTSPQGTLRWGSFGRRWGVGVVVKKTHVGRNNHENNIYIYNYSAYIYIIYIITFISLNI
jgi:hypothetical protein